MGHLAAPQGAGRKEARLDGAGVCVLVARALEARLDGPDVGERGGEVGREVHRGVCGQLLHVLQLPLRCEAVALQELANLFGKVCDCLGVPVGVERVGERRAELVHHRLALLDEVILEVPNSGPHPGASDLVGIRREEARGVFDQKLNVLQLEWSLHVPVACVDRLDGPLDALGLDHVVVDGPQLELEVGTQLGLGRLAD
mmetsp:Transcript_31792/g.71561  ORF Transcript_31792/g.71561 Transcript_31792/m.71561 type:complete len:200 (-) Transcript_31792:104-703(-)